MPPRKLSVPVRRQLNVERRVFLVHGATPLASASVRDERKTVRVGGVGSRVELVIDYAHCANGVGAELLVERVLLRRLLSRQHREHAGVQHVEARRRAAALGDGASYRRHSRIEEVDPGETPSRRTSGKDLDLSGFELARRASETLEARDTPRTPRTWRAEPLTATPSTKGTQPRMRFFARLTSRLKRSNTGVASGR